MGHFREEEICMYLLIWVNFNRNIPSKKKCFIKTPAELRITVYTSTSLRSFKDANDWALSGEMMFI